MSSPLSVLKGVTRELVLATLEPDEKVLRLWRTLGGGRLGLVIGGGIPVAADRRIVIVKTPATGIAPNVHAFPYREIRTVHVGKPGLFEARWAVQFSTSGIDIVQQPVTRSATVLAEWRGRPNIVTLKKTDALEAAAFLTARVSST